MRETRATSTKRRAREHGAWLLALALACLLAQGCSFKRTVKPLEVETGPGAIVTHDGLHLAKSADYGEVYVKLDADFSTYTGVMLDPVEVAYKRKPTSRRYSGTRSNFALSDRQTEDLKRRLHEAFAQELTKGGLYALTEEPGPDVLRLGTDLIDLVVKVPTDTRAGSEYVFTSSTGEMTLLMELRDSLSGEILARVVDRREVRAAGHGVNDLYYSNSVTDTSAVRRVFKRWAEILRLHLEEVHQIAPEQPLARSGVLPQPARTCQG